MYYYADMAKFPYKGNWQQLTKGIMMKTVEYIELLKSQKGLSSDYAAAKFLGVTRAAMSSYKRGKSYFSDQVAVRLADELGIPEGIVLADIHAEREHDPKLAKVWEQIARQLKSVAACCFLIVVSGLPVDNAQAASQIVQNAPLNSTGQFIHYTN